MKTRLTAISFALALAAAIFLLVGSPAYSGFRDGRPTHATLIEINGEWAIVPVMFPVLVALVVR